MSIVELSETMSVFGLDRFFYIYSRSASYDLQSGSVMRRGSAVLYGA